MDMNEPESYQPISLDEKAPLALVRYGLAKEIRLYSDELIFVAREDGEANAFPLSEIAVLSMQPGEHVPSKLLVLIQLLDGTTVIAGEGMTNVRDFVPMVHKLREIAPHIAFDPEDLEDQLQQALINRRQTNMGCYGTVLASVLLLVLIFVIGSLLSHR
jgi:hypothetical protein